MAIADANQAARDRAARRHPSIAIDTEIEELLAHPNLDAVAVATPVHAHFEPALAALRSGRHVLLGKPMTMTLYEAHLLVDEAARRGLTLMADHAFAYTPAVLKIAELIKGGELSLVQYYDSTRIKLGIVQNDVSVIWDLAVHDLTILDAVMQERPVSIAVQAPKHVAHRQETRPS